jgi:hypothetical protein
VLAGKQGRSHGGDHLDGQDLCLLTLLLKENFNGVPGELLLCFSLLPVALV